MKISIKTLLIGGFIGLQVIPTSIILASSYLTSQRVLLHHARDIMENIATFSIRDAQGYLAPAEGAAQLTQRLADSEVVSSQDDALLEQYFYEQLALQTNFSGIYLGRPDGGFVFVSRMNDKVAGGYRTKLISINAGDRRTELIWKDPEQRELSRELAPGDSYDPRQRPWYKKAIGARGAVWTDPYIFFTSQRPGLTVASPAFGADGQLLGVVGVDIEIAEISTFLSRLKVGKNGLAFIVNQLGDVVAFPDPGKLKQSSEGGGSWRLTKITELDDPLSRKAFASLHLPPGEYAVAQPVFGSFDHQGRTYHTMFAPFSDGKWPWAIGIYLPEDDYLGPIKQNRLANILVMIGVAALASVVGLIIARGVARPMTALRTEAAAVRDGDLGTSADKSSMIKEIQETSDSFTEMKEGLLAVRLRNTELTRGLEQSTEELRDKEMHLRATFTSLVNFSDALVVRDPDGIVRFANPAAGELLGTSIGALLGQTFPYRVENSGVLFLRDPGGDAKTAEVRVVETEWEGRPATLVALRDITERRRMEDEIRWRAATLEALHEVALELSTQREHGELLRTAAVHAARLLAAKGAVVYLHQGDQEVLREAVRHNLGPPDGARELARGEGVSGRVLITGKPLIVNDYARWDGRWSAHQTTHFNACVAAPIRWGDRILGVLLVGDDTPRTFHEADIAVLEWFTPLAAAALEQQRLLAEAESLYQQAQRDAGTKTALLQEVNHRVKNNLSAIIGLLYTERRHAAQRDNPVYQHTFQNLIGRMQSMATVHNLLTASEWSPVPLRDLVSQILESALQALPGETAVTLQVPDTPIRVPPALANNLAILLHELAINAVKHAFPGRTSGTLAIDLIADEHTLELRCRDDGPGYPEKVLRGVGHNMGLYLLRRITERDLGGTFELSTGSEGGAVTRIRFPFPKAQEHSHG
ncbi:MAG: cache domain-containing protein [Deferrisomatales bacterium]|nr:cache domain-containing protein [Deferrisomatales bacterium]